jgi:hypothetical protein
MAMWRLHPVRFAALLGAFVGFANALIIELGGLLRRDSRAALPMLFPESMFGSGINGTRVIQTASILIIEVVFNAFVWALLLAVPTALVVAIRRTIGGRRN